MGDQTKGQSEEEIPYRVTNVELARIVREQVAKNKRMEVEIENLKKDQARKEVGSNSDEEEEEEEKGENPVVLVDQRQFIESLKRVGGRDTKV